MNKKLDLSSVRKAVAYVKLQSGCDYNNNDNLNAAYNYLELVIFSIEHGLEIPKPPVIITIQPM
jgi:hypothetical protein